MEDQTSARLSLDERIPGTPQVEPQYPTFTTRPPIESVDKILPEVLEDLKNRKSEPELPIGLEKLDEVLWGLHRNELCVLAGRPGEGKSTLALQIASHLAMRQKNVLYVSLEMTRQQLTERLLVQMTQTPAWLLRTGKGYDTLHTRLQPLLEQNVFGAMSLRIVSETGYFIDEIVHLIHRLKDSASHVVPDVMIIDFVQLISLPHGMQRFDAIAEYLRSLKELAMRENMAILVCSQLNREAKMGKNKEPALANLKGSGSLEELADCVLLLHWQELGTEERPEGTRYQVIVGKQRFGAPGAKIHLDFKKDTLTFCTMPEPTEGFHESAPDAKTAAYYDA